MSGEETEGSIKVWVTWLSTSPKRGVGIQGTKLETYICFSRGAGRGCLCLGCEVPAGVQEVKVTGLCKGKADTQVSGGGERYDFSLLSLPVCPIFSNSRSPQKARGFTGMTALYLGAQCNKGPSTSPSPPVSVRSVHQPLPILWVLGPSTSPSLLRVLGPSTPSPLYRY